MEIDEHSKSINAAFVSGDGEFMVSVSLDNTVRTWSNFILPGSKPACEVNYFFLQIICLGRIACIESSNIFVLILDLMDDVLYICRLFDAIITRGVG